MYQPYLFIFVISLFFFSCTEEEGKKGRSNTQQNTDTLTNASNDTLDSNTDTLANPESNPVTIDSHGNEITLLINDSTRTFEPHIVDTDDFSITFPSKPNNDVDSTEQTNVYIYNNEGDTERYLLLIKDFTELDFNGQSEAEFLDQAVEGVLSDFEPNEIGLKENIMLGTKKGIKLMFGSPEKNFHSWLLFLKGRTLYQVIIVKNMEFPTNEEMALFNDSFSLK